jgi:hypothetical protein
MLAGIPINPRTSTTTKGKALPHDMNKNISQVWTFRPVRG